MYPEINPLKKNVLISGGWGYGNRGDNAILSGLLTLLVSDESVYNVSLTSFSVEELDRLHGLRSSPSLHRAITVKGRISQFLLNRRVKAYLRGKEPIPAELTDQAVLIGKSDVVVLAGGGYFNDEWESMLLAQYATIRLASDLGKPIIILGQSIGKFSEKSIKSHLKKHLALIDRIVVRDRGSFVVALKAGYPENHLSLAADMANLLTPAESYVAKRADERPVIGLMVQNFRHSFHNTGRASRATLNRKTYFAAIVDVIRGISERRDVIFRIVPSTVWDEPFLEKVCIEMDAMGIAYDFNRSPSVAEYISSCQHVDVMLSTNMHPVILASTAGRPSVALSYHFKLGDYMEDIGLGDFVEHIDSFSPQSVVDKVLVCLDTASDLSNMVRKNQGLLRDKALRSISKMQEIT